jgi:hypothetical protein
MIEIFVIRDAWLPSDELKGFRPEFHNSPRTIHRGTIHRTQSIVQNSPRIMHHEKIKIPLDEFLILLD